jgi:hypothetical protein
MASGIEVTVKFEDESKELLYKLVKALEELTAKYDDGKEIAQAIRDAIKVEGL